MIRPAALLLLAVVLSGSITPGQPVPVLEGRLSALLSSWNAGTLPGGPPRPDESVACFIDGGVDPALVAAQGAKVGTRAGGRLTARIPLSRLESVSRLPDVRRIRAARRLQPVLDLSLPDVRGGLVHTGLPDTARGPIGRNVLVGIVDTGVDWNHADFRTLAGTTRIAALWDQTDAIGPPPASFSYGSAWTAAQIDLGLCRQVDNTFYGHGTHVGGIAAGNGRATGNARPPFTYSGVAPGATLAVVKTTFDDTDVLDAVNWVFQRAAAMGLPAVVNLSLGGEHGPHDGTTDLEIMLNALSGPGRIVVASAGNSNGKGTHGERIVPQAGEGVLSFRVFGYTPSPSISEGVSLDAWYQGGDNLSVTIRSPLGQTVGPVAKGLSLTQATSEGFVSVDHTAVEAANLNGDVRVMIDIDDSGGSAVASGDWEIRLTGIATGNGGEIDCWIYDHSFPFPPAFLNGREEAEIVIEPSTADSVIGVAAHVTRSSWVSVNGSTFNYGQTLNRIATFSSVGPRRDGVLKPDFSAPGSAIGSSHSTASNPNPTANILPDGVHKILQGTSMSAPHAAGAVALLLEKWPALSATQAKTALMASARSDALTGVVPNATWGHGRLDLEAFFETRLAFTPEADPPRFAHPGGRVYLLNLCAVAGAGAWPTRYRMTVTDSKGWLHYENEGVPVPVASWTGLSAPAAGGQRRCVPPIGYLLVEVPPGTPDGEFTLVTLRIEPEGVPFLEQTITTQVTVGATVSAGADPAPATLDLSVSGSPAAGTAWSFRLGAPRPGSAELILLDVQGRLRATIWRGEMDAGWREIAWSGRDERGGRLPGGVYYARLSGNEMIRTRPVIVLP